MTAIDGEIGASLVGAFIGGDCADLYFERDRVIRQEFEQAVVGLIEGEWIEALDERGELKGEAGKGAIRFDW